MQRENNSRVQNSKSSQSSLQVSKQGINPIDYQLLKQSSMEQKAEGKQFSKSFLDQSKMSQLSGKLEIDDSRIEQPTKLKNVDKPEGDNKIQELEIVNDHLVEQNFNQDVSSSSILTPPKSIITQQSVAQKKFTLSNDSRFTEENPSQDDYFQTVITQLLLELQMGQQALNVSTVSSISTFENQKLVAHIEEYIKHISIFYPKEIEFLRNIFHDDYGQMLKKFKRVFPIKQSHGRHNKELPPELKKRINKYMHYNLPQWQKGQYSKYLILNLSFKQFNLPKMLLCQWKNIIELRLRYCGIDENGWQLLVNKITQFDQLRLVDLSLNQIKVVKLQEFHPFMKLQFLKQLDLKKNPLIKQPAKVLIQAKKLIGSRFIFEQGISEFHLEHFKWQNYMKLDKQDLKMMEKISWTHKKFDTQQWKCFVYQFKLLQSLTQIDFSENLIQKIALDELASLNQMLEKDQAIDRKLDIILQCNPLSKESLETFQQFYKKFNWSKLCIIHQKITTNYHQKRLTNLKVKNQVSLIFLMALKGRAQIDIKFELQNLRFTIENIVMNDNESEFANRKYLEEIVDYVLEEMNRVHGDKNMSKPLFLQNAEKFQKAMFKDYEKAMSLAKENKMIEQ